ncbi:MAG: Gfo/Idh/MocA family protein [Eubacteriales bacterium]
MAKKNAAIIGYGGMGSWHADYMKQSDVVNLMGIYDIKPERCQVAEKNGIHAYSSLEALLDDPAVDLVTIAVPNDLHKPLAIQAMAAGKHVISEKPVTLCSEDLQEMIDASHKYHRLLTVHQNRRWDGEFLLMRDIYRGGELGQVYHIESRVHGSRGIPGDWRQEPEHGGGMILDWGIHLIDQVMGIVTDRTLRRIWCKCDHITNELVDDGFQLEMYFDGDLTAHVEVGTSNFIKLPRFYMTGANGSALIPDWTMPARVVWCHNYSEKDVVPVRTAAGITKTMAPRDEKSIASKEIPQPAADVHDFYRNFVKAIDGEEEQIVTHHQMMVDMKIMEAAFTSDRTGMPVDVELKF